MSSQWEVVGKKKEKGGNKPNGGNVPKDQNKKKQEVLSVKIEDVLPKSQVKNLYLSGGKNNKENVQVEKKDSGATKKPQKKPDKPQEAPKPKPPKSIESALNSIDVKEFESIFEKSKLHFPGAPIVWLKELAQYLNQKVPVEVQDPVFTSKPQNYPLNVVPTPIKNVIETAVKEAGKDNVLVFFDSALTSVATDMSKNSPALGHKVLLQYVATTDPEIATTNITKHLVLRNSYQNRPNVGLSILWVVGQGGYRDFQSGLKVFRELMLPLLDLKHYSRFVTHYLINILKNSDSNQPITKEEYSVILEAAFEPKKNFPNDLKTPLNQVVEPLGSRLFNARPSKDKLAPLFEFLLPKLTVISNKTYHHCISNVLEECLLRDHNVLGTWVKIYAKHLVPSGILLHHIEHNWKTFSKTINKKEFFNTLAMLTAANGELLMRKKKEDGLHESADALQKLTEKMTRKGEGRSSFRWLLFLVTIAAASLLYFDVKQKGSWQDCNTRRTLNNWGVLEHTHRALDKAKQGVSWVDGRIEETFPGYQQTVADFAEPYQELSRNLCIVVYNIGVNAKEAFVEKYPGVVKSVEDYVPALVEQSQNAVKNVWSTSVLYVNRSVDYLQKEVFVGQLSPENMQRVVIEAFNTTQLKATEYYHWLYEKVQTTIK